MKFIEDYAEKVHKALKKEFALRDDPPDDTSYRTVREVFRLQLDGAADTLAETLVQACLEGGFAEPVGVLLDKHDFLTDLDLACAENRFGRRIGPHIYGFRRHGVTVVTAHKDHMVYWETPDGKNFRCVYKGEDHEEFLCLLRLMYKKTSGYTA